ncbi:hypothetical protein LSAT2_029813 [Lamellibrachia satsuma]|nr:hypothetical protein LSAT2_029813 [Lamellibrachia satsuma]
MCRQSRDPDRTRKENHNIKTSNKCPDGIATRDEVFTAVDVRCPGRKSVKLLRLKIDTGAQGNTLPIRTLRQMYGNIDTRKILTPIGQIKFHSIHGWKNQVLW